ncbi:NAD-dependent epimerase [Thiomicrospira sp. ALE5]|uniref:NAD-dependent epimerase n=1 Tax=Thiomicrospira sp. ALE5 TaxID=748650 RepID=UPI0008E54FE4|nr:NAD-dependent epimerase [Thiomicrospira sp. ALE5]SFR49143.1 UDP-glucuronate 4-epimerase [Thiomicrospira sp. ALE5]
MKLNIQNSKLNILVTGAAGFIGYHLIQSLKLYGHHIVGIDNLNDYYDPQLKLDRLKALGLDISDIASDDASLSLRGATATRQSPSREAISQNLTFIKLDLADRAGIQQLFAENQFDIVVNLGAQAGVRYSIDNPHAYVDSNLVGFVNILEGCRHAKVKHLVYASSSSVYGMNIKQPFSTEDRVDYPISLYAATKKSNELMAHTYSHLYGIPTTGLRFFTVYGPMGRPDMAYFSFTKKILAGETINVFNNGDMKRDFTYIDDIVEGITRVMERPPFIESEPSVIASEAKQSGDRHGLQPRDDSARVIASEAKQSITNAQAPYKIYNIGNNQPVTLRRFISAIETATGKKANENLLPMQAGDVPITYADVDDLIADTGFKPATSIEDGIAKFVEWYKGYYN